MGANQVTELLSWHAFLIGLLPPFTRKLGGSKRKKKGAKKRKKNKAERKTTREFLCGVFLLFSRFILTGVSEGSGQRKFAGGFLVARRVFGVWVGFFSSSSIWGCACFGARPGGALLRDPRRGGGTPRVGGPGLHPAWLLSFYCFFSFFPLLFYFTFFPSKISLPVSRAGLGRD